MAMQYEFTKRFKKLVEEKLNERFGKDFHIKSEMPLSSNRIRVAVDLEIMNPRKIFLVEYEIHRADPSNNIAKIAYWMQNEKPKQDVTVIQFFSPHYDLRKGGKSSKRVLAEYLGQELIKKCLDGSYILISPENLTRKSFDDTYESFQKEKTPTKESITKLNILVEEIVNTISEIIKNT